MRVKHPDHRPRVRGVRRVRRKPLQRLVGHGRRGCQQPSDGLHVLRRLAVRQLDNRPPCGLKLFGELPLNSKNRRVIYGSAVMTQPLPGRPARAARVLEIADAIVENEQHPCIVIRHLGLKQRHLPSVDHDLVVREGPGKADAELGQLRSFLLVHRPSGNLTRVPCPLPAAPSEQTLDSCCPIGCPLARLRRTEKPKTLVIARVSLKPTPGLEPGTPSLRETWAAASHNPA